MGYLKQLLCFVFVLMFANATMLQAEKPLSRQRQWDQAISRMDKQKNRLGRSVGKQMKEMIVVLNLLGFKTKKFSEGHLKRGEAYPWIDLQLTQSKLQQLAYLIDDYYQLHDPISDTRLILQMGPTPRLQSQGVNMQSTRAKKETKVHMKHYKKEMKHFKNHLKTLYFQDFEIN